MKVKIGDTIYDSERQPIMLILNEEEKKNISEMGISKKYCSYPDDMSYEEAVQFTKINK